MITGTLPQTITEDNMNKTFQVPVWFNVQAENAYEAEMKVSSFLQPVVFPMEYAVEDAIEIEEID